MSSLWVRLQPRRADGGADAEDVWVPAATAALSEKLRPALVHILYILYKLYISTSSNVP